MKMARPLNRMVRLMTRSMSKSRYLKIATAIAAGTTNEIVRLEPSCPQRAMTWADRSADHGENRGDRKREREPAELETFVALRPPHPQQHEGRGCGREQKIGPTEHGIWIAGHSEPIGPKGWRHRYRQRAVATWKAQRPWIAEGADDHACRQYRSEACQRPPAEARQPP